MMKLYYSSESGEAFRELRVSDDWASQIRNEEIVIDEDTGRVVDLDDDYDFAIQLLNVITGALECEHAVEDIWHERPMIKVAVGDGLGCKWIVAIEDLTKLVWGLHKVWVCDPGNPMHEGAPRPSWGQYDLYTTAWDCAPLKLFDIQTELLNTKHRSTSVTLLTRLVDTLSGQFGSDALALTAYIDDEAQAVVMVL